MAKKGKVVEQGYKGPDLNDPRDIEERKTNAEIKRDQELADLRAILDTPQGKRFIWRLLERNGVFRRSYEGGDHADTAFNEGRRNEGLWLMAEISRVGPHAMADLLISNNESLKKIGG